MSQMSLKTNITNMWHSDGIESDSDEFTYHSYIDSNVDKDLDDLTDDDNEEAFDDDIVESSISIFPELTPVITKIIDVPKDNILIHLKVTSVIMKFVDVFPKDITSNNIRDTILTYFPIVSTPLSQIEYKKCRVIVDNESCTNAVFFEIFENDGLKSLLHSHTFKVSSLQP